MARAARDQNGRTDLTRKGARRVREIVETATAILMDFGFGGLNKRRVADRLGISHGNVSYYFPTNESLWLATIDHELREYYHRHHPQSAVLPDDAQARFDDYVTRWIDEYQDRLVRVFFSQILTVAEINEGVAGRRDVIYEAFLDSVMQLARPLVPDIDAAELEQRALTVVALLEGLQAVSGFRPGTVAKGGEFEKRIVAHVNSIVLGKLT